MKYIILLSLLLVGCNNDTAKSLDIKAGDKVLVMKGFYEGCTGILTEYLDNFLISDSVILQKFECIRKSTTITKNWVEISVNDIK